MSTDGGEPVRPYERPASEPAALPSGDDDTQSITVPELPPEEKAAVDPDGSDVDDAQRERSELESKLTEEQIRARARADEADRDKHFRDNFEIVAVCTLYLAYVTLSVLALTWAIHLVLPQPFRWLSPSDLNHIQTLLTAGVLVGVIGGHFKKRLEAKQAE